MLISGALTGHGELAITNSSYMEWTWHRNVDGLIVESDTVAICNTYTTYRSACY